MGRTTTTLLLLIGALAVTHGRGLQQAPSSAPAVNLAKLTAAEAVAGLCNRTFTAVQYVQALLAQKTRFDCLNAWASSFNATQVLADAAAIDAKAARGEDIKPLCGLPLGVKDSIDALPYPTTAGTPALEFMVPPFEAPLVTQWRQKNGIIMGKTKLHELSGGNTCASPHFGAVLNPYNVTRVCGGSSGGTAAAVTAFTVPVALCEDTAGSCRHTAANTGHYGLRPSMGCYNFSDSLVPATFTQDTVGVEARTASDLILADMALRAPVCAPNTTVDTNFTFAGKRIGLPQQFFAASDFRMQPTQQAALAALRAAGATLVPLDFAELIRVGNEIGGGRATGRGTFQGPRELARYLYTHNYSLSVVDLYNNVSHPLIKAASLGNIRQRIHNAPASDELWVKFLREDRPAYIQAWKDVMTSNKLDSLFYPFLSRAANEIDQSEPFVEVNGTLASSFLITAYNAQATFPAVAVPVGMTLDNVPNGMNFVTPPGTDGLLLSMALAWEKLAAASNITTPPPPDTPACSGCTHQIVAQPATYNISSNAPLPQPGGAGSVFKLLFNGTCADPSLASYGRGAPVSTATAG